jgi:heptosyltransferase I
LPELLALVHQAQIVVSGDTGPLHLATAAGTPVVALFGPTDPRRNGPWASDDVSVSEFHRCTCHHKRRCTRGTRCLDDIGVDDVMRAVGSRLARAAAAKR